MPNGTLGLARTRGGKTDTSMKKPKKPNAMPNRARKKALPPIGLFTRENGIIKLRQTAAV